jgi:indole-3-glycerol phosphate synthase
MSILADIAAYKRKEIVAARESMPFPVLEARASAAEPSRGFRAKLMRARSDGRLGLIAEIKKMSPSKGLIRADFDPPGLARAYELGGATCLSVLTDTPSFGGRPEHLTQARKAIRLPVLRKDFMLDPYQVLEARALGADCVLVILACVGDQDARALLDAARGLTMDALVEVHDERELDRALALDSQMIGINNRDLTNFVTDLAVTLRLAPRIPQDRLVVAESGLGNPDDLRRLADAGVTTFLVGESLLRARDVEAATRALLQGS